MAHAAWAHFTRFLTFRKCKKCPPLQLYDNKCKIGPLLQLFNKNCAECIQVFHETVEVCDLKCFSCDCLIRVNTIIVLRILQTNLLVFSELYADTDSKDVTYGAPKPVGHACHETAPDNCHVDDTTPHQQRPKDLNSNGWVYDCGLHRKMQGTRSRTKDLFFNHSLYRKHSNRFLRIKNIRL